MFGAAGQYEAALLADMEGKNVDVAAAKVIVEESGGKVTDFAGNEQNYLTSNIGGTIISNSVVHSQLIKLINNSKTTLGSH